MAFPRAFQQDTYDCSGFYVEHKMEPVDCQVAFSSLPHGSQPILFKNHPDEGDPYSLPYEVRYGKSYAHEPAHDLRKPECPFTGDLP